MPETLAEMIERAREARGWSYAQLWREVQMHGATVGRYTVWQWCRGDRMVAPDHQMALYRALGWGPAERLLAQELLGHQAAERRVG